MTPIPKNLVVTKTFAPNFQSELSDREIHSPHGGYFRDHFCIRSRGHFWSTFGQHLGNTIFHGTERNGFYGTDSFWERNGTDFTERIVFGNGTERNGTVHP